MTNSLGGKKIKVKSPGTVITVKELFHISWMFVYWNFSNSSDFESRNSDVDYRKKNQAKTIIKSYSGTLT